MVKDEYPKSVTFPYSAVRYSRCTRNKGKENVRDFHRDFYSFLVFLNFLVNLLKMITYYVWRSLYMGYIVCYATRRRCELWNYGKYCEISWKRLWKI